MKHRYGKKLTALFPVCGFWLLVSCTPATSVDSAETTEPADAAAGGGAPAAEQSEAKPTDVIDRFFAPLDNAVTDINRDMNKGDSDTPAEPDE